MCIENLQKLNISSYYRNEITLVPALKLSRAELPKCLKYLMSDNVKQLKRYEMIAILLNVVEYPSKYSHKHHSCHYLAYFRTNSRIFREIIHSASEEASCSKAKRLRSKYGK